MTFGWPQIVYLALMFASFGIHLARHGQPMVGNHNGLLSFFCLCVTFLILYCGGFFS
jgi:hypothetical protein